MCPPDTAIKQEEVEGILPSLPGDATPRGAKAKHEVPEPLTPSESVLGKLPPKAEDDSDDILTSLCGLFDDLWPGDADDESDAESDGSEPESPRCRGLDFPTEALSFSPRTYFMYGAERYFFDQDRNVFREYENGMTKAIHRGQAFPSLDGNMLDLEFIDGLPYYFGIDGAIYYSDHASTYRVPTWNFDPMSFSTPSDVFQSPFAPGPEFSFSDISQFPVSNGGYCDDAAVINTNPYQGSVQDQNPRVWSPSSSSAQSPIMSTGSRASSSEPLEPLIASWKQETKVIQEERNHAPPSKLDRRRCRHCNKIFRRPSSLEDHLNVHTGAKPHMCPFERCNTGFATKSNMKRHFITHRVGKLEEYRRGRASTGNSLTATYNAKAFHTQRFRLVPA